MFNSILFEDARILRFNSAIVEKATVSTKLPINIKSIVLQIPNPLNSASCEPVTIE